MNSALKDTQINDPASITAVLTTCLEQQRTAYLAEPDPDFRQRKQDLLSLQRMVIDNQEAIIVAINKDYGNRSRHDTLLAEIIVVIDGINFALKHLETTLLLNPQFKDAHQALAVLPDGRLEEGENP